MVTTLDDSSSGGVDSLDADWPVRCRSVYVEYGDLVAVDGASFSAKRGEIVGLLGPNGAGKTSLIRALTTILPATDGDASVAGFGLDEPDEIRQRIGVVPESSGYPAGLSANDYVRYHGQLYGLSNSDASERATKLLERVGLSERAHSRIGSFSRGMRQRLGIARALINSPEVMFLDEPTLGLDPGGQEEILHQIRTIADQDDATVVITSHILADIERICDRVVIMHEGRVVADGTLNEVITISGVPDSLSLQIGSNHMREAMKLLDAMPDVGNATQDTGMPNAIDIELVPESPAAANEILKSLLLQGIEIRAFEHRGSRLNDAFLALTTETDKGATP